MGGVIVGVFMVCIVGLIYVLQFKLKPIDDHKRAVRYARQVQKQGTSADKVMRTLLIEKYGPVLGEQMYQQYLDDEYGI